MFNQGVAAGALVLFGVWTLKMYLKYRHTMNGVGWLPGHKYFLSGRALFARLLPNIPFVNRKSDWIWKLKYDSFKEFDVDIFSVVGFWPSVGVALHTADPYVIKQIATQHSTFPKPLAIYKVLSIFGPNILATEGEEWRRHRKIVARCFGETNHRLVWEETIGIVSDLFTHWDRQGNGGVIEVPSVKEITREIAIMVLGIAAFGIRTSWEDSGFRPEQHRMSFKQAIAKVSELSIHRAALPDWVLRLYATGRETKLAYEEMGLYMREMIETRRAAPNLEEKQDLFSRLINANQTEKDGTSLLSDDELMGNVAIFELAGHGTAANTLAFALGLLALHPDTQEKFYQIIRDTITDGHIPTYEHIPKLDYGMAIIYETLRMYPIVPAIPKLSAHDTEFTTTNSSGASVHVPIPANTAIVWNIPGLHYNEKYWDEPFQFRPERFVKGDYNKNAFIPFSAGPRACIGRRFAEVETLAVLTLMVSTYKIEVTEEPQHAIQTFEQRKERILKGNATGFALVADGVSVTFRRRHQ